MPSLDVGRLSPVQQRPADEAQMDCLPYFWQIQAMQEQMRVLRDGCQIASNVGMTQVTIFNINGAYRHIAMAC